MTTQKSHTLLVTHGGNGKPVEVVYCPDHLAVAIQNLGAFKNGECGYPTYRACEVCESQRLQQVYEDAMNH